MAMTDGDYQPPGFVDGPNRCISGDVKRGTLHLFDEGRFVANTADALTAADVEVLRARGHRIVEDIPLGSLGTIEAILAERQRADESIRSQLAAAIDRGDVGQASRLQAMSYESAGLLSAALAARDRELASAPASAALPTPVQPQPALRW